MSAAPSSQHTKVTMDETVDFSPYRADGKLVSTEGRSSAPPCPAKSHTC